MNLKSLLRCLCYAVPLLVWNALWLALFVICLTPGFVRFAWYYFVTAHRTCHAYNTVSCRQYLDVYTPHEQENKDDSSSSTNSLLLKPVVVFYTGGAWCIGYKMWGALLARALTAAGVVVVIPDYRNYPIASIPEILQDVEDTLQWTLDNIREHGGDPNKIVIVGQSAGGHLACTALLRNAMQRWMPPGGASCNGNSFAATDFRGIVSLSAPYHMQVMQDTFTRHGLDQHLVQRIFGGETDDYDPYELITCFQQKSLQNHLPPVRIYHGTLDKTVPLKGAEDFSKKLQATGVEVQFHSYQDWTHTDPILEGPMDADHRFHSDLLDHIREWTDSDHLQWPDDDALKPLCPRFLIQMGRFCMPF